MTREALAAPFVFIDVECDGATNGPDTRLLSAGGGTAGSESGRVRLVQKKAVAAGVGSLLTFSVSVIVCCIDGRRPAWSEVVQNFAAQLIPEA